MLPSDSGLHLLDDSGVFRAEGELKLHRMKQHETEIVTRDVDTAGSTGLCIFVVKPTLFKRGDVASHRNPGSNHVLFLDF